MKKTKKPFTTERYNEIKTILKENKIESYELENYVMLKDIKYLRHIGRLSITDDEILNDINSDNKLNKYEQLLGKASDNNGI